MKIYNGDNMILGRMAAIVAKEALLGEEVAVVNCEKVVISGRKAVTLERELGRRKRKGYPLKSQARSRLPDRFVRRAIRGMLPWKQSRGKEAFKRVMCYPGLPSFVAGKEIITLQKSSASKLPSLKYMTVGELCHQIGGKTR